MIDHIAIMPQLFELETLSDKGMEFRLEQVLLEIGNTGLLANLRREEWSKLINKRHLPGLAQSTEVKLRGLLAMLIDRKRLVKHQSVSEDQPVAEEEWLAEAFGLRDQEGRFPLDYVLTKSEFSGNSCAVPLGQLSDSPKWEARRDQLLLTSEDLEPVLLRLLGYARRLDVIDPYLRPHGDGGGGFVRLCSNLIACRRPDRNDVAIRLHIGYRQPQDRTYTSQDSLARAWRDVMVDLRRETGLKYELHIWADNLTGGDNEPSAERFHNRYLLTDQHGIMAGDSFSLKCDDTWVLLDYRLKEVLRARFLRTSLHFKPLLDEPVCVPARKSNSDNTVVR